MSEEKVTINYDVRESAIAEAIIINTKAHQENGKTRYSAEADLGNGEIISLSCVLYENCEGHKKKGFVDVKGEFYLTDTKGLVIDSVSKKRLEPCWQQRIEQFDNVLNILVGPDGLKPIH